MSSKVSSKMRNSKKETSGFSNGSDARMFQSRPFVVQSKTAENLQKQDLKKSLMRAERYGHHLSQIDSTNESVPTATQPKLEMGQPVQCAFLGSFFKLLGGSKNRPQKTDPQMKNKTHSSYFNGNKPLTTHHKYPYSKTQNDLNPYYGYGKGPNGASQWGSYLHYQTHQTHLSKVNINNQPKSNVGPNYMAWADPTGAKKQQQGGLYESDVAWVAHNSFIGPKDRLDDPANSSVKVDTHFTKSGTVTPNSKLALDLYKTGIAHFDPNELVKRLNALPNKTSPSPYNPSEWTQVGNKWKQTGMPQEWNMWSIDDRIKYAQDKTMPT